jgi:hypothetical protein
MRYTKLSGKPLPDSLRHHVAWIGDDSFFGHFLRIMSYSSISLQVILHTPQTMNEHADRKALSNYCAQIIASAL